MLNRRKMFISKTRAAISAITVALLVFYSFNFVPKNVNIAASKSIGRQIFDYVLNFLIFFVVAYLVFYLISFLIKIFRSKK